MTERSLVERVNAALSVLPGPEGGIAIVLATSGEPPAMAVLSTGDVFLDSDTVSIGIHASSSAVDRLGDSFTLLVPLGAMAARIEAGDARAQRVPPLARIIGRVNSMRPTAEPPWTLEMRFAAQPPDHPSIPDYISYWQSVRGWLAGDRSNPPEIP